MDLDKMAYILITSAYNEDKYLELNIKSVIKQSILPSQWIIVNNGSTDDTEELIRKYAKEFPWITYVYKPRIDFGISGFHAAPNFSFAMKYISEPKYLYIGNLDADILIDDAFHYEALIHEFQENPSYGILSGVTYYIAENGEKVDVLHEPWHTTGGMKLYRRECFEEFGGLVPDMGWDGIDEFKAMYRHWKTRTIFNLKANHLGKERDRLRQKGKKYFRNKGQSLYRRSYPTWFICLKSLKIIKEDSHIASINFMIGYLRAWLRGEQLVHSLEERKYIRKFHWKRIKGKLIRGRY